MSWHELLIVLNTVLLIIIVLGVVYLVSKDPWED